MALQKFTDRKKRIKTKVQKSLTMNQLSGQITIFISLVLTLIISVLCVSLETARRAGEAFYFQLAAKSSVESLFACYDKTLWEDYRLLFLSSYDEAAMITQISDNLSYYYDTDKGLRANSGSLYPLTETDLHIDQTILATDNEGIWLEKSAAAYMQYGIGAKALKDMASRVGLIEDAKKAASYLETLLSYTEEVVQVEKSIQDLANLGSELTQNLQEAQNWTEKLLNAINGDETSALVDIYSQYKESGGELQNSFQDIAALFTEYRDITESLTQDMAEGEAKLEEMKTEFSEEMFSLLETEWKNVTTYASYTGERYQELFSWRAQLGIVSDLEKLAASLPANLSNDSDWDKLELNSILASQLDYYQQLEAAGMPDWLITSENSSFKEAESYVDKARQSIDSLLLDMVFPQDRSVSEQKIETEDLPSTSFLAKDNRNIINQDNHEAIKEENTVTSNNKTSDRLLFDEYILTFMNSYSYAESGGEVKSTKAEPAKAIPKLMQPAEPEPAKTKTEEGAQPKAISVKAETTEAMRNEADKSGTLQYEVEYILNGHRDDQENLAETARDLLLIREGINYITLLADQNKRAEAETIAAGIAGITGNYIVIKLVALCVLAVWAWEDSVSDVKALLKGETIPLLSLGETNTEWLSLSYQDYLRILLAIKRVQTIRYRTMDIIQSNLSIKYPGFRMDRCVYGASMTMEAQGESLFLNLFALNRLIPNENRVPIYLTTINYQYK